MMKPGSRDVLLLLTSMALASVPVGYLQVVVEHRPRPRRGVCRCARAGAPDTTRSGQSRGLPPAFYRGDRARRCGDPGPAATVRNLDGAAHLLIQVEELAAKTLIWRDRPL